VRPQSRARITDEDLMTGQRHETYREPREARTERLASVGREV
jgi:hypothetical protein